MLNLMKLQILFYLLININNNIYVYALENMMIIMHCIKNMLIFKFYHLIIIMHKYY